LVEVDRSRHQACIAARAAGTTPTTLATVTPVEVRELRLPRRTYSRFFAVLVPWMMALLALFCLLLLSFPGCRGSEEGSAPGEGVAGKEGVDGAVVQVLVFTQPG
jgi:hypothetical protein